MSFVPFALFALAAVLYLAYARLKQSRALRDRIRAEWGKRQTPRGEMSDVATLHRLAEDAVTPLDVDDRTWSDLDMDEVFREIDRTASSAGQEVLYARLRRGRVSAEDLRRLDVAADRLQRDPRLAARLRAELLRLNGTESYFLPHLFLDELPDAPLLRYAFPLLSLALISALVASFITPAAVLVAAILLATNIVIHLRYRSRFEFYVRPLRYVRLLVLIAEALAAERIDELNDAVARLRLDELRSLKKRTSWLDFDEADANDVIAMARQYANMFLLFDASALSFSLEELRRRRGELRQTYEAVGWIDLATSVASWRTGLEHHCAPNFVDGRILELNDVVHPLLENAVANSVVAHESLLITGSNMSGKSTFLRTVGVNVLLAQTLGTALARSYRAPLFDVRTSIGRSDSLTEGKSYYLAEVERVGEMLRRAGSGVRSLFILDELFRGTNTIERVAASFAVLERIDRDAEGNAQHLTLVATHDLELAPMLGSRFAPHHFREVIEEGELRFDYQLKDGVSSTRNAIALLELMDFPRDVVARAREAAERAGAPAAS